VENGVSASIRLKKHPIGRKPQVPNSKPQGNPKFQGRVRRPGRARHSVRAVVSRGLPARTEWRALPAAIRLTAFWRLRVWRLPGA